MTLRDYILGGVTTIALTLAGACYSQTNSQMGELAKTDREQSITIEVVKEQLRNLAETLREVRDDVKGIRDDIRDDPRPRP